MTVYINICLSRYTSQTIVTVDLRWLAAGEFQLAMATCCLIAEIYFWSWADGTTGKVIHVSQENTHSLHTVRLLYELEKRRCLFCSSEKNSTLWVAKWKFIYSFSTNDSSIYAYVYIYSLIIKWSPLCFSLSPILKYEGRVVLCILNNSPISKWIKICYEENSVCHYKIRKNNSQRDDLSQILESVSVVSQTEVISLFIIIHKLLSFWTWKANKRTINQDLQKSWTTEYIHLLISKKPITVRTCSSL